MPVRRDDAALRLPPRLRVLNPLGEGRWRVQDLQGGGEYVVMVVGGPPYPYPLGRLGGWSGALRRHLLPVEGCLLAGDSLVSLRPHQRVPQQLERQRVPSLL